MIIFHEGLPRSGKSYESIVYHVIPALKNGRKVFCYVDGLNHEKIADLAEITIERCRELLIQLTAEHVPAIYEHVEKDSMVILDELQNFFPNGRYKPTDKITKFVAEHGHFGLDIVCMGQSFKDVHSLWRRRTERKIVFNKLSSLGSDKRYAWAAYQAVPQAERDPSWVKAASGIKKYEEKYFGSYLSHTVGTENTEHYKDGRFSIWNNKALRYGLPLMAVGLIWAIIKIYGVLHPEGNAFAKEQKTEPVHQNTTETPQNNTDSKVPVVKKKPKIEPDENDLIYSSLKDHDYAITYVVYDKRQMPVDWLLEVWDGGKLIQSFNKSDFHQMGYKFHAYGFGIDAKAPNGYTLHLLYNRKSLATDDNNKAGVSDMTASNNPT